MRGLIILIILILLVWKLWPQPEPLPIEETYIGDQVKVLEKAEDFEQQYLDATKARQDRIDRQVDDPDG